MGLTGRSIGDNPTPEQLKHMEAEKAKIRDEYEKEPIKPRGPQSPFIRKNGKKMLREEPER